MTNLLTQGNTKLGKVIWTFNLMAIDTCPGKSKLCESICYADRYTTHYPSCGPKYESNLKAAESNSFVDDISKELKKGIAVCRIHSSGDFYNAKYIRKWISIIKRFPHIRFYAYTRSWNVKRLHKALKDLSDLSNMSLWISTDNTMPVIPKLFKHLKVAYLSSGYEEESGKRFVKKASKHDLIFRPNRRKIKLFKVKSGEDKAIVCPKETGQKTSDGFSCSSCEICF